MWLRSRGLPAPGLTSDSDKARIHPTSKVDSSLCFQRLPELDGGGGLAVQVQGDLQVLRVHADRVPQPIVDPVTYGEKTPAFSRSSQLWRNLYNAHPPHPPKRSLEFCRHPIEAFGLPRTSRSGGADQSLGTLRSSGRAAKQKPSSSSSSSSSALTPSQQSVCRYLPFRGN